MTRKTSPALDMNPWPLPLSRLPELMDDPALPEADHMAALGALATINLVSRTAAQVARGVQALAPTAESLTVVDLACGGGDVTVEVQRLLSRVDGLRRTQLVGIDISPRAVERAQALAAKRGSTATFAARDVLRDGCPPCDVALCSLFLHHFDDADAVSLLRHMATAARVGVVISDLIRSRMGLALAVIGTTVLCSSRVARVDGPMSVRAARTMSEYRVLVDRAGLSAATIRRAWPERAVITWRRPNGA